MYLLYSTTVTKSRYEEVFVTLGWKLKEEKIGNFFGSTEHIYWTAWTNHVHMMTARSGVVFPFK